MSKDSLFIGLRIPSESLLPIDWVDYVATAIAASPPASVCGVSHKYLYRKDFVDVKSGIRPLQVCGLSGVMTPVPLQQGPSLDKLEGERKMLWG
jgi:hypothetical protein